MGEYTEAALALQKTFRPELNRPKKKNSGDEPKKPHRKATSTKKAMEKVFNIVVKTALAGDRCPTNGEFLSDHGICAAGVRIMDLAMCGRVKNEVWAKNWRIIEITSGEHKGARTAESPFVGDKPTKTYHRKAEEQ